MMKPDFRNYYSVESKFVSAILPFICSVNHQANCRDSRFHSYPSFNDNFTLHELTLIVFNRRSLQVTYCNCYF